jgi:hypothetical protein
LTFEKAFKFLSSFEQRTPLKQATLSKSELLYEAFDLGPHFDVERHIVGQ